MPPRSESVAFSAGTVIAALLTLLLATFGLGFSVYDNKDVTRQHVVGLDFSTGSLTHSIRFSYLKFQNQIVDATLSTSSLPFCLALSLTPLFEVFGITLFHLLPLLSFSKL